MGEEHDEIPACLGSAQSGVHVFAPAVAILHEAKHGRALNDLADLRAGHAVLVIHLLDDRIELYDPSDLHHR